MTALSFKKCFALDCPETVPRHLLMCRNHWFKVPADIREQVAETWAAFERGGRGTLRPYILATSRAQLAVAEKEGKQQRAEALRTIVIRMEQLLETQEKRADL